MDKFKWSGFMKVAAFVIYTAQSAFTKLDAVERLREKVLYKDPIWHFFLDTTGFIIRCDPKNANQVEKFFQKEHKHKKKHRIKDFEPSKHEYFNIRFVGDELQQMFHFTSLMALKYPGHVIVREVLERMAHITVNQLGQHDFKMEAQLYLDMAYSRAALQGRFLGLPKFIHRFIIKRLFI